MKLLPASYLRSQFTQGTLMAALTVISATATFFVLSETHSPDLATATTTPTPSRTAPARELPQQTAASPIPETSPVETAKTNPVPEAPSVAPTPEPHASRPLPSKSVAPALARAEKPEAPPRLRSKGPVALIAADDSSLQQMIDDPATLSQLIRDGRLFSASPGTKVEILERRGSLVHVRLLEGATAERSGWVTRSAIANPAPRPSTPDVEQQHQ